MPAIGRPPLTPRGRLVLAWCGAAAHPLALFFAVQAGPYRSAGLRLSLSAAATTLPFALLRRRPVPAMALMLVGMTAAAATRPGQDLMYLPVLATDLAVGYLAANRPRRIALPAAVTTLAVQSLSAASTGSGRDVFVSTVVVQALVLVSVWLGGRSVRERRAHAAELRSRTAAEAVAAERLRIARELHDVVAHSIGVIAIQSGMGRRVIDTQPEEARKALAAIEATSRETLAGLRRTLGALRRHEPGAGPDSVPVDPAPGLADVEPLAASMRSAGVRVDVRWIGDRRHLPAAVDLAAFRIVQEAVTNVVRHADTRECRVIVEFRDRELLVEVADDGCGDPAAGAGYGIIGMRERVTLLDGCFTAGPRPGGGFRVAARLPLSEGERVA